MQPVSDRYRDYPNGDYAPHILSGAEGRRQSGRRAPGHHRPTGSFPWYTTYMIDQGPYILQGPDLGRRQGDGPAVICLPPNSVLQLVLPSSTLYSWLEWGAIRLPLCPRDHIDASRKYPPGLTQPPPEAIWNRPLPLELPAWTLQPTAGMMVRTNALWWKGGSHRMLANAELSLWIARCLFPPPVPENTPDPATHFPGSSPAFREALRVLQDGISLSLDIRDWATALEMTPRTLQRWCRQESGKSPQEILDRLRLSTAEQLLRQPDLPLREISLRCGFASPPSFSNWFTRSTGLSPRRWGRERGGISPPASADGPSARQTPAAQDPGPP